MLTLYYKTDCPYAQRVRIILAEKRLPFTRRVVAEDDRAAEIIEASGGRLPVLVDGSFVVTDAAVIAEYVEDAFGRPVLRPFEARGRAMIRAAMRRIDVELMRAIEDRAEPTSTDNPRASALFEALSGWDRRLGDNGLFFGMEFSIADVWLVSAIDAARRRGWDVTSRFSKLLRWDARMRERASVRTERLAQALADEHA